MNTLTLSVYRPTLGESFGIMSTSLLDTLKRASLQLLGVRHVMMNRIQTIGSGISQAMDSAIIQTIDKWSAVPPHLQQQAKEKIDRLKDAIEHGGHCPYSEIFIPPPESTGVR